MSWIRLLLLVVLPVGCATSPQQSRILDSPVVSFDELFAPADTIRLDPSIIIGRISFLDVNQSGSFLVTDDIGRSVNQFSSSGEYVRDYPVPECLPDIENFHPISSRFLGQDHVVVMTLLGAVVVFGTDGRCVGATRRLSESSIGFCTSDDSVFFLGIPSIMSRTSDQNAIIVYSPELRKLREFSVELPEYPVLNMGRGGLRGRNIDCFNDGPFYTYLGSMDAIPAHPNENTSKQRPEFYEKRPRDLSPEMSREQKRTEWDSYISTYGIFALDGNTRMLIYRNIDDQWQPKESVDPHMRVGVSIASNTEQFPSRSTISSILPIAAGYGYIYGRGDPEMLPDGDVGNPAVLRYRFIPPIQ
ncbi:MAG: hypothetical protein F4058_03265 [Rhodothermaceae bacterium]|nr:hypothetical protein [Rhodothermaceae bacterium]MYF63746.1 hypothetical protein [Rhodothermaceae bacterium]MYI84335.1 hypothetical protein [Rhodothermaceae bacterium]